MMIILVRHGETVANNEDLLQGHLPGELSEKGRLQAKAIADALKDTEIDAIFSSDLKRGRETAEEINRSHNVALITDKEARERCFGIYQGGSRTDFYRKERALKEPHRNKPAGGESFEELYSRTKAFLTRTERGYRDKSVLVVGHGDFARMCLGILTGKDVADSCKVEQANACINILEVGQNLKGTPIVLNSTGHLTRELISDNKSSY